MADLASPRHIRNVQQAVDPFFQLDESTVVGKVADLSSNLFAGWVLLFDFVPRVLLSLLHTQRHLFARLVDAQHADIDLVADVNQFARMIDSFHPRHFTDVDQALDARLKLHKGTVVHHVDDFTFLNRSNWVLLFDFVPWVRQQLLQSQSNFDFLAVDIQNHHVEVLIHRDHLRRMRNPCV